LSVRNGLVLISLWLLGLSAQAQDVGFTQFYINPSLLNPSFVGAEGRPALYLSYRKQWVGIDGSPTIMNVNIQTATPNRVNLGLNVSNYQLGLVTSSSALFTGGYTLPLATDNFLRFGMSIGGSFTRVDAAALNFGPGAPPDPLLTDLNANTFQLAGNLGISYHLKGFHAGVALPALFQPVYLTASSFQANFKAFDNITVHASNRFMLQKGKHAFEPYVIYRLNKGLPGQFEAATLFHYEHAGWIGISYRQEYGMSGLLGLKLNKTFALGYSYSLPSSGENSIGRASHEVHIALLLGPPQKKEVPQTYSFVNTEIIKKRPKSPQMVVKNQPPPAKQPPAKTTPTQTKEPEKPPVTTPPVVAPVVVTPPVQDAQHLEEQEKIARLEAHADNPTETHDETHHPHAERHEFVKQGGHHAEMDLGNYIIGGVFRSEANAKHYSDGLLKMGFKDVDYGYLTEKKLWYVHVEGSDDINLLRKERDELRKLRVFRDAWLLTVHNN
jgi:type IX secretion system PorP/SprF family membrane protein